MATNTVEERIARIEERMDTFATKADLANMRTEMKGDIADLKVDLIKWMVGTQIGFVIAISGLLVAYAQLFGGS